MKKGQFSELGDLIRNLIILALILGFIAIVYIAIKGGIGGFSFNPY